MRETYLSLITDVLDERFSLEALRMRRGELQAALHKLYRGAPHTNGKAYFEAQDALKNREDLTFTEKKLDLLPPPLRREGRLTAPQIESPPRPHLYATVDSVFRRPPTRNRAPAIGTGLGLLQLQLELIKQLAATLGRPVKPAVPHLRDDQFGATWRGVRRCPLSGRWSRRLNF